MDNFLNLITDNTKNEKGLNFIEAEIKLFYFFIASTKNMNEADLFFRTLEDIQFILAHAVFSRKTIVSSFLTEFIYDCDRIDDLEQKKYLYKKIKALYSD